MLRFWDLNDLQSNQGPIYKLYANHGTGLDDQLTGIAFTKDNTAFCTTDTSGRIKKFDCSEIKDWREETGLDFKIKVPYFINAHRSLISSIEIIEKRSKEEIEEEERKEQEEDPDDFDENDEIPEEPYMPWPDKFILTSSQDKNIFLHRLSNGVKICQFGQENYWNIYDMTPYQNILPNYERNFLAEKKQLVRERMHAMMLKAKELNMLPHDAKIEMKGEQTEKKKKKKGIDYFMDLNADKKKDDDKHIVISGASTRDKLKEIGISLTKDNEDDGFEKELQAIYEPLEEDAVVTSSSEDEFDFCKGQDITSVTRKTANNDPKYRQLQKDIIDQTKLCKKILDPKLEPSLTFIQDRKRTHRAFMKDFYQMVGKQQPFQRDP